MRDRASFILEFITLFRSNAHNFPTNFGYVFNNPTTVRQIFVRTMLAVYRTWKFNIVQRVQPHSVPTQFALLHSYSIARKRHLEGIRHGLRNLLLP